MDRPVIEAPPAVGERWKSLFRAVKAIYVVAVVVAMGWGLSRIDVPDQEDLLAILRLPTASGFVLAWCLMAVLLGWLWQLWVKWRYDVRLGALEWLYAQALAWSGRYLPGKLGLVLGKLVLARDDRLGWRQVGASVLVEQLAFVAAGVLVGVLLLPATVVEGFVWIPSWAMGNWSGLRAGVAVGVAAAFVLALRLIDMIGAHRSTVATGCRGVPFQLALLGLYVLPHLLVGAAFHALVLAASPGDAAPLLAHSIAVLALAHVAGIAAVFAPAGLGVRELVLAVGLSPLLEFEQALLLAAVLRFLTLLADGLVVIFVGGIWAGRKWRSIC